MARNPSFTDRVVKTAELLSVEHNSLTKDLEVAGITNDSTGVSILDTETTTIEDLVGILENGCAKEVPKLKLKAAASILKGNNLTKTTTPPPSTMPVVHADAQIVSVAELIKANRPIANWGDKELLERYAKDREYEVEQELNKRAKQQNFIVLVPSEKKYEPGKEVIDIDMSLDLLKSARKRTNPSMLPANGTVLPVYKITELNPEDRIVELCPICGETLYKGYCEKCVSNFSGIGDDELAYVNLIADSDLFEASSHSDRKAVVASARKGLEDLKQTWPSLMKTFGDLKLTNSLPKLRVVMNRPSDVADPYFQDGNRSFGNRTY